MPEDYYGTLGVGKEATSVEIRDAYRILVRANHPDLNPDKEGAEGITIAINRAYGVLSDPKKRARYDLTGYASRHERYEDIFAGFADDIADSIRDWMTEFVDDLTNSMLNGIRTGFQRVYGGVTGGMFTGAMSFSARHNDNLPDIIQENDIAFAYFTIAVAMGGTVAGYKGIKGLQILDSRYHFDDSIMKFARKFRRKTKDLATIVDESEPDL